MLTSSGTESLLTATYEARNSSHTCMLAVWHGRSSTAPTRGATGAPQFQGARQRLVAQVKAFAVRLLSFDEDCLLPLSWEVAYTLPCVRSVNLTKTSSESLRTLATKLETDLLAGWRGGSSNQPRGRRHCRTGAAPAAREQHWPHGRRLCRTGAAICRTGAASAARDASPKHDRQPSL